MFSDRVSVCSHNGGENPIESCPLSLYPKPKCRRRRPPPRTVLKSRRTLMMWRWRLTTRTSTRRRCSTTVIFCLSVRIRAESCVGEDGDRGGNAVAWRSKRGSFWSKWLSPFGSLMRSRVFWSKGLYTSFLFSFY